MPDYQAMYLHLFNAVTDAAALLERAQQETENICLSEEPLTLLDGSSSGECHT